MHTHTHTRLNIHACMHAHTELCKYADIKLLEKIHNSIDSGYLLLIGIVDDFNFLLYAFLYL